MGNCFGGEYEEEEKGDRQGFQDSKFIPRDQRRECLEWWRLKWSRLCLEPPPEQVPKPDWQPEPQ